MKTESKLPIKEIILMIFSLIIAVLVVVCIMRLDNNTKLLLDECNEIKEELALNAEKIEELNDKLGFIDQKIDSDFTVLKSQGDELIEHAVTSRGTAVRQYKKTLEIEKTYSDLLEEERKIRIDSSEFDLSIESKRKEAKKNFDKGHYSDALKNYREILEVNPSDNEVRLYKMLSLFYINRMDSTNYSEIQNDIKILKENGITDEKINEAEQFIKQERNQE